MTTFRIRRAEMAQALHLPTGRSNTIIVQRPCAMVLDVEDAHFNHDRCILLPDLQRVDGSLPRLDERRITGLGVLYAGYVHQKRHPDQRVLVIGHSDASGSAAYNQTLSEKRAENVEQLFVGERERWRQISDDESHPDDIQAVLRWQSLEAGWNCDPGGISGRLDTPTKRAVGRFQLRYNEEVRRTRDEGLDLPYGSEISVDEDPGPETWGAFFDVYQHGLMRLLQVETLSELQDLQAMVRPFDSLPAFVGCGSHIPFEPQRRLAFEVHDEFERPQRNPFDRRVEVLFFDPEEEPELACHAGGGCEPSVCPIYTTGEYTQRPIGVPRGLQIGEVNIHLSFRDPSGRPHALPRGLAVEVRFDDGSTLSHALDEDARLQFVVARDKSSFSLALDTGDTPYLVLDEDDAGVPTCELLDREEALRRFDAGARFFKLPAEIDTIHADWSVPPDVAFEDGEFVGFDDPQTQIGERTAPARVILEPRWQHLRFDYFDRWRSRFSSLPQARVRPEGTDPIVLQGFLERGDFEDGPEGEPEAEAAWDIETGEHTIHCLAWVRRRIEGASGGDADVDPPDPTASGNAGTEDDSPRIVPDAQCLTRFVMPEHTFVRADGPPDATETVRTLEVIGEGHEHHDDVTKAGVERLRYYDVPVEWCSFGYHARLANEASDRKRAFATIADPSTHDAPFVIDLDNIVFARPSESGRDLHGRPAEFVPSIPGTATWDDADENKFTIWDHELAVYEPSDVEPYFTDVAKLAPPPVADTLNDHPPFTRLITHGRQVFEVFDRRVPRAMAFRGLPIGARLAIDWGSKEHHGPFASYAPEYSSIAADDTAETPASIGPCRTLVLRCCGQRDGAELFRVVQYIPIFFDFTASAPARGRPLSPPPPEAERLRLVRECLVACAARWQGDDEVGDGPVEFVVGPKTAPIARGDYHALLVRAVSQTQDYHIELAEDARAFMRRRATWSLDDLEPADGYTAAHEFGHGFGLPDEYIEKSRNASLQAEGISDRRRSSGCPYDFDGISMMKGNQKPRARAFWHLALWMADTDHTFAGQTEIALHQGPYRYAPEVTPPRENRERFPVVSKTQQRLGSAGLFDIFGYAIGTDGFNGGDALFGASPDDPFALVVVVRVKLAWELLDERDQTYDAGVRVLHEARNAIHTSFNQRRRLLAHGAYAGRNVRARILFSPRFVVRTFPGGDGDGRQRYLESMSFSPQDASGYEKHVDDLISEHEIHAEVMAGRRPGGRGITDGEATPRLGAVRTRRVPRDAVRVFGSVIGLERSETRRPSDFAPLVDLLAPTFTRTSLEFIR